MKLTRASLLGYCIYHVYANCVCANSAPLLLLHDERKPFHYHDAQGKQSGVTYQVVNCIMKKIGLAYTIKSVPWKRAQSLVHLQQADAFFAASQNKDRDSYAHLTDIIADQYWSWFTLKDNPLQPDAADFKEKATVASWPASNSGKWLTANGYQHAADSKLMNNLLERVKLRRIDAAFSSNIAMYPYLSISPYQDDIHETPMLHKPMGVYFGFHATRKHHDLIKRFNDFIPSCSKKTQS